MTGRDLWKKRSSVGISERNFGHQCALFIFTEKFKGKERFDNLFIKNKQKMSPFHEKYLAFIVDGVFLDPILIIRKGTPLLMINMEE